MNSIDKKRRLLMGGIVPVLASVAVFPIGSSAAQGTEGRSAESGSALEGVSRKFLVIRSLDENPIASLQVSDAREMIFPIDSDVSLAVSVVPHNRAGYYELSLFEVSDGLVGDRLSSMIIGDDTEAVFESLGLSVNFITAKGRR